MTRAELLPEIFKLSPEDQLMIAEAIRDRLIPESELEFKRELDRRVAYADQHPEELLPLETVMKRLRGSR